MSHYNTNHPANNQQIKHSFNLNTNVDDDSLQQFPASQMRRSSLSPLHIVTADTDNTRFLNTDKK